ncbi:MAG: molybdopterin-dependent oxidoreductase [Anaerolineae bacterium]|nr:molybdopterin-dependent oxidoreductase [Anaerolineae bacterium]
MTRKPQVLTGALVGGLLTAPLLALIALGQQAAGLPFLPSDFFNPVRDLTPGGLITAVIDSVKSVILTLNLGRVDTAAKNVEFAMAISLLFVLGIIGGAIFFALFNRSERPTWMRTGLIGGAVVGIVMALISLQFGISSTVQPALIGAIWLAALFLIWGWAHAWAYTRLAGAQAATAAPTASSANNVMAVDRRQFLITLGAASATLTIVGAGLGALIRREEPSATTIAQGDGATQTAAAGIDVPPPTNLDDNVIPAPGTRPEITPVAEHYRIDISLVPPRIDEASWTLPFVNMLSSDQEILAEFTLDELKAYDTTSDYITMSCISNEVAGDLISTTYWTGVSFKRLLEDVPLPENATHLKLIGGDNFDEIVALDLINSDDRIMLAYYWDGKPLEQTHGFPLRIHIPNHYGMKQPKWIVRIEVLDGDQDGYWVRRGWDKQALVRATSVIDTVAVDSLVTEGDQQLVPIGGIAWAGDRGISRVEVRVDDGEWQEARLRTPISDRTWTIWRYDWPFAQGDHKFEVRCVETDGTPQIEDRAGVRPSGATGIHQVRETL